MYDAYNPSQHAIDSFLTFFGGWTNECGSLRSIVLLPFSHYWIAKDGASLA